MTEIWEYGKYAIVGIIIFFIGFLKYKEYLSSRINITLTIDNQCFAAIKALQKAISVFYKKYNRLPNSIEDMQKTITENKDKDNAYFIVVAGISINIFRGIKNLNIQYHKLNAYNYKICADFINNFSDNALSNMPNQSIDFDPTQELYKKGHNCFEVKL